MDVIGDEMLEWLCVNPIWRPSWILGVIVPRTSVAARVAVAVAVAVAFLMNAYTPYVSGGVSKLASWLAGKDRKGSGWYKGK